MNVASLRYQIANPAGPNAKIFPCEEKEGGGLQRKRRKCVCMLERGALIYPDKGKDKRRWAVPSLSPGNLEDVRK